MERLWTPWRYDYITGNVTERVRGVPQALAGWIDADPSLSLADDPRCVFCNMIAAVNYAVAHGMSAVEAEREALIVFRGENIFICLNRYPYSTGHLLALPYRHCSSLAELPADAAQELMVVTRTIESVLRTVYRPDGLNFGLNLGEAAGAGVANHLHLHALPRWSGDTNFMTVTAETRILPETLETTWRRVHDALLQP